MLRDILFSFWFMLPVAFSNVTPILVARIPGLARFDAPLDDGRTWHGQAIFGPHKTWRGLFGGMVLAGVVFSLQQLAAAHWGWAMTVSGEVRYDHLPLILGPLLGFGALGGDAIESFFKRQRGVPSGESWIPFDQLDYIIGGVVVSLLFVRFSLAQYLWIFVIWFLIHLGASYAGWRLGLKERPI
jgi:CDP-2,3-bis-(O-geranylgeranyl)-sn-glycerol synthase